MRNGLIDRFCALSASVGAEAGLGDDCGDDQEVCAVLVGVALREGSATVGSGAAGAAGATGEMRDSGRHWPAAGVAAAGAVCSDTDGAVVTIGGGGGGGSTAV